MTLKRCKNNQSQSLTLPNKREKPVRHHRKTHCQFTAKRHHRAGNNTCRFSDNKILKDDIDAVGSIKLHQKTFTLKLARRCKLLISKKDKHCAVLPAETTKNFQRGGKGGFTPAIFVCNKSLLPIVSLIYSF